MTQEEKNFVIQEIQIITTKLSALEAVFHKISGSKNPNPKIFLENMVNSCTGQLCIFENNKPVFILRNLNQWVFQQDFNCNYLFVYSGLIMDVLEKEYFMTTPRKFELIKEVVCKLLDCESFAIVEATNPFFNCAAKYDKACGVYSFAPRANTLTF